MKRKVEWQGNDDLLDQLTRLGPGICTVASSSGEVLEFDIDERGKFGVEPELQDLAIRARIYRMAHEGATLGITVRTFTSERVRIPHGSDPTKIIEVPVKELRGFQVTTKESASTVVFSYEQLPASVLKDAYSFDANTGKPLPLPDVKDHRFIGPEDE